MPAFTEDFMVERVLSLVVALPPAETPQPFVVREEIGTVAVAALTHEHFGERYELTGTRLPTFADAVDEISGTTARDVRYVPVSIEEQPAAATEQGVAREFIDLLAHLFSEVVGCNARPTDAFRRMCGLAAPATRPTK
jgi:uncharacterized protein YbjT (DUF2867 family)